MITTVTTPTITDRILCPICRAQNRPDARFCQQCGNDVLLDNIYRITRVIKEGGMGVVYQAVDEDGEVYAVKEMHDRFTDAKDRQEGIQRFVDEARLLLNLRGHPAIPHVYRSFIDEGRYYLSMEFIFGEDLEDILKRQQRFPERQVLLWADQLCDVLEYLHTNGLIYRDMKPSNVMITQDGHVKIVDFGIAKLLQPGHRGTTIGTPGYAPPEQYQGLATPQSDIYALAATLHHLLTGRDPRDEPPFSFPSVRSLQPDVSLVTSQAIEKALQMEVGDRFQSVAQFRRALPIPTGDRRPTRPFDPVTRPTTTARPAARPQPQPRPAAHPQPQPRPAVRPQPQPRAVPPLAQPRPQPPQRRGGGFGRFVRRVVLTGLLAGGMTYGAITYGPQIEALIQEYIPTQPQPADGNTAPVREAIPFETEVEITVTEQATEDVVRQALRDKYLATARQQYPNAELDNNRPPGYIGGLEETPLGNGYKRVRATISGRVVP